LEPTKHLTSGRESARHAVAGDESCADDLASEPGRRRSKQLCSSTLRAAQILILPWLARMAEGFRLCRPVYPEPQVAFFEALGRRRRALEDVCASRAPLACR